MKDFIKNFKIPIILGGCALIAVIATLLVISGGFSSNYKLCITNAHGVVSVTSADVSEAAADGTSLKQGDVVTIGADSSCTIAYQGKKNSEKNYLVLGPDTQIVVSDKFNGKNDGEIFLRYGVIIANFADDDKASILVRTESSMTTLEKTVAKIAYSTNEFMSYTELYTFMGNSLIQLYDTLGNTVNTPEYQIEKCWGRVMISDEEPENDDDPASAGGPYFDLLNDKLDLNILTAFDLKQLLTIAALVGDGFPYDTDELKAVYELKAGEDADAEPIAEQTEGIFTADTYDADIQTAGPIETSPPPTATTLPGQTQATAARPQTPASTTVPAQTQSTTTTASADSGSGTVHIVTIDIDGEESIQEVVHGGNAVKPADPAIDGLTFIGWDNSFENITQDTVITALFSENAASSAHIVTVIIGDRTSTLMVEHGSAAPMPADVSVNGYIFKGWDKDYSNITSDITITAILERAETHTVTFIVNGESYPVQVEHGESVIPPYTPPLSSGFIGWDKSLGSILTDMTITAVFSDSNYHIVTFIIDGNFHSVRVKDGENVTPPFWPIEDSNGNKFLWWDNSLENITSDVTITAIYG